MATSTLAGTSDKKPLEQFHYFPRLPPELRIAIWQMAIRPPDLRGVHYFSLFRSIGDRESPLLDQAVADRQYDRYLEKDQRLFNIEYKAAAPRVSTLPEYSWFNGNQSLYAWDAGLFSACRESSQIIRKSIKLGLDLDQWVIKAQHNGETVYLRDHGRDLFFFEFEREDVEASMSIRWGVLLCQLSFSYFTLSPSNIAFEFHPSWITSLPEGEFDLCEEPSPRGLVARAFEAWCRRELPGYTRIWLIDRSIQLRKEVEELCYYPPWKFSDLKYTYVSIKSQDVFFGSGKKKRERDSVFYLCKRLNRWGRTIRGTPRGSCLGVLASAPTDKQA